MKKYVSMIAICLAIAGCSKADFAPAEDIAYSKSEGTEGLASDPSVEDPGGSGNTSAGVLTAAEWNDLGNWDFWGGLMLRKDFNQYAANWGFFTNNRIAVKVTDAGNPVPNATVALLRGDKTVWKTRTDNHGLANCWAGLFQNESVTDTSAFCISIDGRKMEGAVKLSGWDAQGKPAVNEYELSGTKAVARTADIAFIVDATGSMGDEIAFLKNDLEDIIGKVAAMKTDVSIRTAALFYRDEGDEYVTKESNFSNDLKVTSNFIKDQDASGGGDYPEAVHTALENGLQKLGWNEQALSRIAFLVLDAPAHLNKTVVASLQDSIESYAAAGIRIIPVAASGVDKSTEFMSRLFAIVTGGTYVFLTNDSGVGSDHIEATVGKHQVELLNELIVRLITEGIE